MAKGKAKRGGKNPYLGFEKLSRQLAARPDVRSPGGLSSSIGRSNPNALIHYMPSALYKRARKKAEELALLDANRFGKPVAIVDEKARRVLKFIRPSKPTKGPRVNPRLGAGWARASKVGGRKVLEIWR
jgi:hypothetical protein